MATWGDTLRKFRQEMKFSQFEVSEKVLDNPNNAPISNWENELSRPNEKQWQRLKDLFPALPHWNDGIVVHSAIVLDPKAKTARAQICSVAEQLLRRESDGLTNADIVAEAMKTLPSPKLANVQVEVSGLAANFPSLFEKPARGVLRLRGAAATDTAAPQRKASDDSEPNEEMLYKPLADWLTIVEEECTQATALGGSIGEKWYTADVVGVWRPQVTDLVKAPIEILAAEVKASTSYKWLMEGFGQSCAYKLFSHRSILVIPSSTPVAHIHVFKALCLTVGVGLVVWRLDRNAGSDGAYQFEWIVRPQRHEPDPFYVNEFAILIHGKRVLQFG